MIIESLESAERRGAKIYCEILGYNQFCMAKHPLSPEENGYDSYRSLQGSLVEAGITPSEIDLVNCHASSTIVGDISEARGVRSILNNKHTYDNLEALKNANPVAIDQEKDIDLNISNRTLISALKGNIAHSQLVAGAVESVLMIKSFETDIVPKIRNLTEPCLEGLNYAMGEN